MSEPTRASGEAHAQGAEVGAANVGAALPEGASKGTVPNPLPAPPAPARTLEWPEFVRVNGKEEVRQRFAQEFQAITQDFGAELKGYQVLVLMEKSDSIEDFEAGKIYDALRTGNANHDKNVLLLVQSRGGQVEPAYQIAKLCKAYAKDKFIVSIPRQAKSAATLLALGADEIHLGALGQLGPIDPQIGGLPAQGVAKALETLAALAHRYPQSGVMLAEYLHKALTIPQIGYSERISDSAKQYAQRLLSKKPNLAAKAGDIAHALVYEYKHHGFVIDLEEAQKLLGSDWVSTDTRILEFSERVYRLFDMVGIWLSLHKKQRLLFVGEPASGGLILDGQ